MIVEHEHARPIRREPDERAWPEFADADRRRSILNLSEEGKRVHDEVAPLALQFERDLMHGLRQQDIEVFNVVMERLLARARLIGTP